jgi:hypothetical protein
MRIASAPTVDHAIVSAAGDHIPVFKSPVKVRDGVATRPAASASDVAEAAPRIGVTRVGDVANTSEPEPVSSVTAAARLAELGVARKVATPVPRPDTPVLIGRPVALVSVADEGVPRAGVTSVGDVANTSEPEPVSSVTAAARLAELGVARKVATPVPRPDTPVLIGRPVALVRVADEGVPRAGVTSVGDVANTRAPEPVSSVTAAARLAELGVPKKVATPVPNDVIPVPPLATASVPETEITPPVGELGKKPIDPKLMEVTPAAGGAPHEGAAPVFPIRTCPVAPTAVTPTAPVPLP